jgi:hypothetical protein
MPEGIALGADITEPSAIDREIDRFDEYLHTVAACSQRHETSGDNT